MNTFIVALFFVGCLLHQYVEAQDDECKAEAENWKAKLNEILDGDKFECVEKLDLKKFKNVAGQDEAEDKRLREEMREWYGGLDEDIQEEAMECMMGVVAMSFEETEITDVCKDKMTQAVEDVIQEMTSESA